MKIKHTILLAFLTTINLYVIAQGKPSFYKEPTEEELFNIENIDSLTNLWFKTQVSQGNDMSFILPDLDDSLNVASDYPDSVYIERLDALPLIMQISYNKIVRNYINMYTRKKPEIVSKMLGLTDYYFPFFESILDAKNMPLELKYLAVIESALNPNAVSRVGATGLWQFMYYTGKLYNLEINSLVDERRDPIKSTYAAINFMQDLYKIYNDWILVIAAYNCGPGNVNKAIRRSGGKKDYWQIYYHLPRETRGYVPAFIAAAYVMNYYQYHNINVTKSEMPVMCDTLVITSKLHFEQIAKFTNLSVSELRNLNPQYRRDIIPGNTKPYVLRLPYNDVNVFIDYQDTIFKYKNDLFFNPSAMAKKPVNNRYIPSSPSKKHTKILYTVKSGDNIGYIAEWYNVKASNIRYWNGLRGNRIRAGQKLAIYKHKSKAKQYKNINNLSFAQKQARLGKQVENNKPKPSIELKNGEYKFYTIKRGDTLWDIAKLFPGVSETDIKQWNGINNASKIKPGQKLKIKI